MAVLYRILPVTAGIGTMFPAMRNLPVRVAQSKIVCGALRASSRRAGFRFPSVQADKLQTCPTKTRCKQLSV